MSADAASLPCPICLQNGIFDSVQSLRDRLIHVSTNKILCPVCQEEVSGLDKLTIHLFSHVKLSTTEDKNGFVEAACKPKPELQVVTGPQRKSRTPTAKNKSSTCTANVPVKFVKIYPKLPVMSVSTVPVVDMSREHAVSGVQANVPTISTIKMEASILQLNTTCDICGLQFVDANILRMHRCLIHNIGDNSNQNITRYQCHLCPKIFKMRGSLMVHLRVAHYGFQSDSSSPAGAGDGAGADEPDLPDSDKPKTFEKNDNKQWQCDVCRKCFTTKYFLKKHKRLHTGETPYACAQCNKTFTFQQSYHKHLLYHNDEKPHACAHCGRAFKELSTLHNHQRIHTGEKPFSCETCGKCFRQRVSYLVHRRIHTGVMPYKCTACNKSFRYKVSQRTHKCQAQPPGTVVRQSGDLVEKLKKKYPVQVISESAEKTREKINYHQISEANAELVRTGAKLSLEDTEADNFTLIAEAFYDNNKNSKPEFHDESIMSSRMVVESNIPIIDKNVPSPSEILKNLCLSKDDDVTINQQDREEMDYNMYKEFNLFL